MLRSVSACFLLAVAAEGFFDRYIPDLKPMIPDLPVPKIPDISVPNVPDFPLLKIPTLNVDDLPIPDPVDIIFVDKCIEDIGCFYTGPPFYNPINRPIPLPPADVTTLFRLFTPTNQEEQYMLEWNELSIRNSPIKADLPTKILIHGFISDLSADDNRIRMKDKLLNESRCNVIIVDWTNDNGFPYAQAVSNTRVVGAKTAKLIQALIEVKGIKAENVHMIGHSLGAHACGYAGERVPNIGRITGLDPAGPYYRSSEPAVRLDTTDANFVDVIHSDGGEFVLTGLGISDPIGHQDFYPNGGRWQPGCSYPAGEDTIMGQTINITQMYMLSGCAHNIGSEYFLESIGTDCEFLSVKCISYIDFENGRCPPENSTVTVMGSRAKPIPGVYPPSKFFLRTNDAPPYCLQKSIYLKKK